MSRVAATQMPLALDELRFDAWLLGAVLTLIGIGVVMVTSSSLVYSEQHMQGNAFYFVNRHLIYLLVALSAALVALQLDTRFWSSFGPYLLLAGILLLVVVMLVGREVNGARRWLLLGPVTVQASEIMKFCIITYLAGYLVRRSDELQTQIRGFMKPLVIIGLIVGLLLQQPDFGAAAVIVATCLAMLFLAGASLWQFIALSGLVTLVMGLIAVAEPYRFQRLISFVDPWADQFGSGYQLVQSLIAFGRGQWFGEGLGNSVQKLSYLPEAHTDFVMAVLAEELGFVGVALVLVLFAIIFVRAMKIGRRALLMEHYFAAYLAYGFGFWLSLQALINMGVASGALPTKGLTLPFVSYGGNSLIVTCVAAAILLRVDFESRQKEAALAKTRGGAHVTA